MASLDLYFEHPLRKLLSTSNNDATVNPLANDAGNWTGCVPYVGNLVGTYRDISACLLSDYLGRPATVYDLRALTEQDVKNLFRIYFWDKLGGDSIPSQDVANIATQNYAHFGNVRNIQRALNRLGENLSVDGVSGSLTRQALARQAAINPARTYNTIREEIFDAFEQGNPFYYDSFVRQYNDYFPKMQTAGGSSWGAVALLILAGWYVKDKL